jgi:hypothetical protein
VFVRLAGFAFRRIGGSSLRDGLNRARPVTAKERLLERVMTLTEAEADEAA